MHNQNPNKIDTIVLPSLDHVFDGLAELTDDQQLETLNSYVASSVGLATMVNQDDQEEVIVALGVLATNMHTLKEKLDSSEFISDEVKQRLVEKIQQTTAQHVVAISTTMEAIEETMEEKEDGPEETKPATSSSSSASWLEIAGVVLGVLAVCVGGYMLYRYMEPGDINIDFSGEVSALDI